MRASPNDNNVADTPPGGNPKAEAAGARESAPEEDDTTIIIDDEKPGSMIKDGKGPEFNALGPFG
jgi:hypothetical protein